MAGFLVVGQVRFVAGFLGTGHGLAPLPTQDEKDNDPASVRHPDRRWRSGSFASLRMTTFVGVRSVDEAGPSRRSG